MRRLILLLLCFSLCGCRHGILPPERRCVALIKLKPTSTISSSGVGVHGAATVHEALASNDPLDPPFPDPPPPVPFESDRPHLDVINKGAKYTVGFSTSSLPPTGTIKLLQLVGRVQQRLFQINQARWEWGGVLHDNKPINGELLTPPRFGPYENIGLNRGYIEVLSTASLNMPVTSFLNPRVATTVTWTGPPTIAPVDNLVHFDLELWVLVELPGDIIGEVCLNGGFKIEQEVSGSIPECD